MAHGLADETLDLILAEVLKIPDEHFLDVFGAESSSIAQSQRANSAVLLVCKRWMRIATPLLYDTVLLRSVSQAQALSRTLVKAPDCALFVKRLRLEGGLGAAAGKILRAATHLRDLHISLRLKANHDVKAMCAALPAVNPSLLVLSVSLFSLSSSKLNNAMKSVLGSMKSSAHAWTNLTTVVISYDALLKSEITSALLAMPNIRAVHLKGTVFTISRLDNILQRWPGCKVHIWRKSIETYDKDFTEKYLVIHAKQLVIHQDDDE